MLHWREPSTRASPLFRLITFLAMPGFGASCMAWSRHTFHFTYDSGRSHEATLARAGGNRGRVWSSNLECSQHQYHQPWHCSPTPFLHHSRLNVHSRPFAYRCCWIPFELCVLVSGDQARYPNSQARQTDMERLTGQQLLERSLCLPPHHSQ